MNKIARPGTRRQLLAASAKCPLHLRPSFYRNRQLRANDAGVKRTKIGGGFSTEIPLQWANDNSHEALSVPSTTEKG